MKAKSEKRRTKISACRSVTRRGCISLADLRFSLFTLRSGYSSAASLALIAFLALGTLTVLLWPGEDAIAGKRTVRFTVWGMPFEDRLFLDLYARGWERLNPEIRVDYGRFADIRTKYNAWFARGEGPEVMRLELTWYPEFVRRGMLEPLNRYIRDPARGLSKEQLAKFPRGLMDLLTVEGDICALPEDSSQYGLFYNRGIFDEHNRKHPEDPVEYPHAGWTWEDLRSAARKLTRYEDDDPVHGRITRAGFDFAIWAWPFLTLLYQARGEAFSPDGTLCTISSPAGVRALEFLRTMQREDRSFDPTLGTYTAGVGADALFATGRTAMFMDGSWRVPSLDLVAPDLDYAVAPLPRGPRDGGRPAVMCGGVLFAISSRSKNKDEAWEFLRWLVQDEQAAAYWDTLRVAPPANLGILNSDAFRSTRGVMKDPADASKGYEVMPLAADDFERKAAWLLYAVTPHPETGEPPGVLVAHPLMGDLYDEIGRMLSEYLRPDSTTTPQEALDRVVARMGALRMRTR